MLFNDSKIGFLIIDKAGIKMKAAVWSMMWLMCGSLWAAEEGPHKFVVTSAKSNVQSTAFSISQQNVPNTGNTPWSVRQVRLHGGKQQGVDLLLLDNGKLVITMIPTRGMSILDVRQGDFRLGWESPVKEVVNPQFINLDSRGGLGWLDGFNEFLVRCGLEFAGHPGKDAFINNTGDKAEMDLTLHGKIGNIPASEVEVLIDRQPPHRIRVRGVVHERLFFGPKLQLTAEISTTPGSNTFEVHDAVTNLGSAPQEFQLIYHTNYGHPLLEAGAKVVAPMQSLAPMNQEAAKAVEKHASYQGPTPGFIEQVYLIHPLSTSGGESQVLLHNAAGDKGSSIRWSTKELPFLTVWKNTVAKEDGYVTGLEPATGFPYHRSVERAQGRLPVLAPAQTRHFHLSFGLHLGAEAVSAVVKQIESIQGTVTPKIEKQPPTTGHE